MDGRKNYQAFLDLVRFHNLSDVAEQAANCEIDINQVYALPLASSTEEQDLYVSANQYALLFGLAGNIDTAADNPAPKTDVQTAFEKYNATHFPFLMGSATKKGNRKNNNSVYRHEKAPRMTSEHSPPPPPPALRRIAPKNASCGLTDGISQVLPEQEEALRFIYLLFNGQYDQFVAGLHQGVDINFILVATSPAKVRVLMSIKQFVLSYLSDNAAVVQSIHDWDAERLRNRSKSAKKKKAG